MKIETKQKAQRITVSRTVRLSFAVRVVLKK